MKKIIFILMAIVTMTTLIGCPPANNNLANPTTELTQEEQNKATSGLGKDMTVIGKIEDMTCDITLNAEKGTFTAEKSSRSEAVSYSGEFFYYNGKLQLKVTKKNEDTLSSAETFCLTATVAETVLKDDEIVVFDIPTTVEQYEAAKTEFKQATGETQDFNLAGKVYWTEAGQTVDGQTVLIPFTFHDAENFTFVMGVVYSGHIDGNSVSVKDQSGDIFAKGTISFSKDYYSFTMTLMHDGVPATFSGTLEENEDNNEPVPTGSLTNSFGLAGTRYYCERLTCGQSQNDMTMRYITTDVLYFTQGNFASFCSWFGLGFTYLEAVNDNKIVLSTTGGWEGTVIGVISDDRKTIDFSGSMTTKINDKQEITNTFKGTYRKVEQLFTLADKTYTSTSAKLDGVDLTNNVVYTLTFTDDKLTLTDNMSSDSLFEGRYFNISDTELYIGGMYNTAEDYRGYVLNILHISLSQNKSVLTVTANVVVSYFDEEHNAHSERKVGTQEMTFTLSN